MKKIKTVTTIKGISSKTIIPLGTILQILEEHKKKYLVKYNNMYWFLDKTQAKPIK